MFKVEVTKSDSSIWYVASPSMTLTADINSAFQFNASMAANMVNMIPNRYTSATAQTIPA